MRKLATMMAFAGASLAAASPVGRIYGFENIRRALQGVSTNHHRKARGSIATGNRHGGPHLHQREIARRARQQGTVIA